MGWIERTLKDAALQDVAHMIEGLLNHELPELMEAPLLKKGERLHSWQERTVTTAVGPIRLRRAYYLGPRGGRYPLDEMLPHADLAGIPRADPLPGATPPAASEH